MNNYTWKYMETVNHIRTMTGGRPSNYRYVWRPEEVEAFHASNLKASREKASREKARENTAVTMPRKKTYERRQASTTALRPDYVVEAATILTTRALKTVEQQSGDPYITRLINSVSLAIRKRSTLAWLADELTDHDTGEYIPSMGKKRTVRKVAGIRLLGGKKTLYLVEKYRKVSATLKESAYMDTYQDVEALISDAYTAIYGLVAAGLVTVEADIWEADNMKAVFRAVNTNIKRCRKYEKEVRFNTGRNHDGEKVDVFQFKESRAADEVDIDALRFEAWDKARQADGDTIDESILYWKAIGVGQKRIGEKHGISQQAVAKRLRKLKAALSPDYERETVVPVHSLKEVGRLAKKAGLSYGAYVAKYNV